MSNEGITIVEVGPRDGFQSITEQIPTQRKIDLIAALHRAGIRRIEATAFVSPKAVPQLADAAEIVREAQALDDMDVQVLVPNLRYAEAALAAGAKHLVFVMSVSARHNMSNVKRSPSESLADYAAIVDLLPPETKMRLNLATAFDCPFVGAVPETDTLDLLADAGPICADAEIGLCDTTGRATPARVRRLFDAARAALPAASNWAFHGHDTYGLGVANVLAASNGGVRVVDASFAGLGGCPFAPGATGNVATEDVVWTFEQMGIATGIDLERLLDVAHQGASLPTALHGGRVRTALGAKRRLEGAA